MSDELASRLDPLRRSFERFSEDVAGALEHGLGHAINGLITGTATLKDAFRGFASDVVRSFSDIVAHEATRQLLALLFRTVGGAVGGYATAGAAGMSDAQWNAFVSGGSAGSIWHATGGTIRGGLEFFSAGGIARARRPLVGVVGEGYSDEGVIPLVGGRVPISYRGGALAALLPNGRSIPAHLDGGAFRAYATGGIVPAIGAAPPMSVGADYFAEAHARQAAAAEAMEKAGDGGNTYIVNSAEELWAMGFRPNQDKIVNVVTGSIVKGGKVRKAINRRPG
jgi:hypothetical protein